METHTYLSVWIWSNGEKLLTPRVYVKDVIDGLAKAKSLAFTRRSQYTGRVADVGCYYIVNGEHVRQWFLTID